MNKLLISILFLFGSIMGNTQTMDTVLVYHEIQSIIPLAIKKEIRDAIFEDKRCLEKEVDSILAEQKEYLLQQGFIEAGLDSTRQFLDTIKAYWYIGNRWKMDQGIWLKDTLKTVEIRSASNTYNESIAMEKELKRFEKRGYPLAHYSIEQIDSDTLVFVLEKGDLILFDSIQTNQNIVHHSFLMRYLGFAPNTPFDMSKLRQVNKRLNELSYISTKGEPNVQLVNKKAILKLEIAKKKASQFDFLLGVLPTVKDGQSRFLLTGELKAKFVNPFKRSTTLFLHYRQLNPKDQLFNVDVSYPYILNTPIGVKGFFSLLRNNDETLDTKFRGGLFYEQYSGLSIDFFSMFTATRLINIDTVSLRNNGKLPEKLDAKTSQIGLRLNYSNLDFKNNPRSGFIGHIEGSGGVREILKNPTILAIRHKAVTFENAYDTLRLKTFVATLTLQSGYYVPLKKRMTILFSLQGAYQFVDGTIYKNEFYRLGGASSIRGFDDQSLLGQGYVFGGVEWRYLFGRNAFLGIFSEIGSIYNPYHVGKFDQVWSGGTNLNLETPIGIFNFSLAIGSLNGQSVDFRNIKTHFGYINLF